MEKHRKKLIKNAAVFDGHSSGLVQGKKIVIEDDIVTEITADEVSEENFDEVFDGTGMVAMPGMTDAHVHMDVCSQRRIPGGLRHGADRRKM